MNRYRIIYLVGSVSTPRISYVVSHGCINAARQIIDSYAHRRNGDTVTILHITLV